MILPEAENSASRPSAERPLTLTVTDWPTASFIWEATVRIQISSYSRNWSPLRPVSAGGRKRAPGGGGAPWASSAVFALAAQGGGARGGARARLAPVGR